MKLELFPQPQDTIATIHQHLLLGRRTCEDVLEKCLAKIDVYEEQIRAWVLVARDAAREQARSLDRELGRGQARGPLHGIPVGIKDIVDVAGWPTMAGSAAWRNRIAERDATIVARLRSAGAVLLGKTVTTQYASFDPSVTRNPWNPARTPGGSSSGSAAAVATGMCLAAIGSQTGGSITRPATYCGVAGCKPTYGRVSLAGLLPLAPSMDHPGPIARTVPDLAFVLDAIAGPDVADRFCSSEKYRSISPVLDEMTLSAPHLGRLAGLFRSRATENVRDAFDVAMRTLTASGAAIQETPLPASFEDILIDHRVVMAVEAARFHRRRLEGQPEEYLPEIRKLVEEGIRTPSDVYERARSQQSRLRKEVVDCFGVANALITPATTAVAPDASTTGDPAFNAPWSFLGLPTISIPTGLSSDGLPLGIQLVGRPFAESDLFRVAYWCETFLRRDHMLPGA